MTAREVFRQEIDGEDGSFVIQLRCHLYWDWVAFRRLTGAMYDVAQEVKASETIERWIASGFWFCDTWIQHWTSHPNFPRPPEEEYQDAMALLGDLAWFLFIEDRAFDEEDLRSRAKG